MLEESQHWINQGTIWSNSIMWIDQNLLVRYLVFFSCLMQKTKGFYGSGFWPHTIHITTGVSLWASPAEFSKAQKLLHPAIASSVLQHVVISCQPCVRVETEKQRYGSHAEVIGGPNGDDGVPPMVIRVFFHMAPKLYIWLVVWNIFYFP